MSTDDSPRTPARRDRREAVREKAAAVRAQQRRRRVISTAVVAGVAGALVVGGGFAVAWTLSSDRSQPDLTPSGMADDGIMVETIPASVLSSFSGGTVAADPEEIEEELEETPDTSPSAEPTPVPDRLDIEVYVDYLSQSSADFQLANAQQLTEWVSEGAARISYHPVALLTSKSNGTEYSERAAAAAACVATYSPEAFFGFNHELLVAQPEIDTDGHSDSELAALAIASGVENGKIVRNCIENGDFVSWAQKATARALGEPLGDSGETLSGPTVLVNGSPYVGDLGDQKEFAQFVLTLASDAYYSTPTPTPTPGATTPGPTPSS
ncbi:thioredoxin domain-containing protein [Microbacterium sp. LRZ72]|uniref:DsbA family protein n=1 Tax=Microbacterium sp. LRZ72 TaxID=2942481 RepID=UPI0029A21F23|nr:thioredoxin domain-containing protein [Microbacterium sp. LRZ72]MDX2375944.1 thioredoxin domain-containing protein [Microbacterium sp. LRZ72]